MAELGHDAWVKEIWRYPVKSMAAEEIPLAKVTPKGVLGDRVYALVDKGANRAATVRTWAAALLSYRSQFLTEPERMRPYQTCVSPLRTAACSLPPTPKSPYICRLRSAEILP